MKKIIHKFDSVRAFGLAVRDAKRLDNSGNSALKGQDIYSSGLSFPQSLKIALSGGAWEEGAKDLMAVKLPALDIKKLIDAPLLQSSVQGFAPIVANYLAGVPDSMFNFEEVPQPKKLIKICISAGFLGDVDAAFVFNRGRAILACINALDKQGFDVEVVAVSQSLCKKINACFIVETIIKRSNDKLSIASLAFALCCAAYLRRSIFRLREACPVFSWATKNDGYGHTQNYEPQGYDVFLPPISSKNEHLFYTPSLALQTIAKYFK